MNRQGKKSSRSRIFLHGLWLLGCWSTGGGLFAQDFVRITDQNNPIVTENYNATYTGSSWQDWDGDGDLDLLATNGVMFRNDGNGSFVRLETVVGEGILMGSNGSSFGDYDNDGDLDLYVASAVSALYRNTGEGRFERVTEGVIGEGNNQRGTGCSFADINNDGYLDLYIIHPRGRYNPPTPPHLLLNNGPPDYNFTRLSDDPAVSYIGPQWAGMLADYDDDGDLDIFIGSGPGNGSKGVNYIYRNLLIPSGTLTFERDISTPMGTDELDSQMLNLVDYDNDGDLDSFATNWIGSNGVGDPNTLYRQDNGVFVNADAGDLTSDIDISVAAVWGDYDNDGDLDCYLSNDFLGPDRYYRNNGDATFTGINEPSFSRPVTTYGASAGDYDNDGDLDLFVYGPGSGSALLHNELNNENHWIMFNLEGTESNRSAIGAKLRARALIGGAEVWQQREISGQTTVFSQNDLRVHFGLGDAVQVDQLEIRWPSGRVDTHTNLAADQLYPLKEGRVTGNDPPEHALLLSWVSNNENQFESVIVVNNHDGEAQEVSLTATRNQGDPETVTRQIPARGFLEEAASSLFPSLGSGGGYSVLVGSATEKLEARWVTNNLSAASGQSPSQGVAVRISGESGDMRVGQTLLFGYLPLTNGFISASVICNVGKNPTNISLRFISNGGTELATHHLENVAPYRPFAAVANALIEQTENVYMIASSDEEPITGVSFVFNDNFGEAAIGNATAIAAEAADTGSKKLLYPWVSNNENQFESILVLNNYGSEQIQVALTARRQQGESETVSRPVAANGFLEEPTSSLFPQMGSGPGYSVELNAPSSKVEGVWVTNSLRAQSGRSPSQGVAIDISAGEQALSQRVGRDLLFGYLPSSENVISAPVIVNAGTGPTDVTLIFYDHDGNPITSSRETLPALGSYLPFANLTNGLLPEGTGNVYLVARSNNQPITGVAFVFNTLFLEPAIGNATVIQFQP